MKSLVIFLVGFMLIFAVVPGYNSFADKPDNTGKSVIPVVILFKDDHITSKHVDLINSHGGEITRSYKIISGVAANIPEPAIEALKKNPRVASVDLDVEIKAVGLVADQQIGADQVWPSFTGNGVRVAILDTGISLSHQEFSGRIVGCHSEFRDPNNCDDKNGHGTFSSGIAGASGVNANAKGVAPEIHFLVDQVLDRSGTGSLSGLISGIEWSVNNNAKVASMSLSTDPIIPPNDDTTPENCDEAFPSLTSAINNAWNDGMIVVAATGNDGVDNMGAPACISSTIAVGAVDSSDNIASFSNYGLAMEDHGIVAPGVDIISTYTKFGGYAMGSGTSMATPVVSGIIALMLEANQNLTPQTIKQTLFGTACSESTCPTGAVPNEIYGYGRVDAKAAVDAVVVTPVPNRSPTADAGADQSKTEGDTVNLDGSGSSDLDDGIASFSWVQAGTDTVSVSLTDATTATPSFVAPDETAGYTVNLTLTVTDFGGNSDSDPVVITVSADNDVPTADAGADQSVTEGATVNLDGSASSDPEGVALTFSWTQQAEDTVSVTLSGANTATPSFVAPDETASYTVNLDLAVNDGVNTYVVDSVAISVTASNDPTGSGVSVASIAYASEGGRNNDKHLFITIYLTDGTNSVSGATVSIQLKFDENKDGIPEDETTVTSDSGTTLSDGSVTFSLKNAPSGCYTTKIIGVVVSGFDWDGITPNNNFGLRDTCELN